MLRRAKRWHAAASQAGESVLPPTGPTTARSARASSNSAPPTAQAYPDWHNDPVPSFGDADARLLIVGLAPGLKGANRTGRPFTGDYAGDLLYATLTKFGLAKGKYGARRRRRPELVGCRITNAVRCVPPENKPTGAEIATCRGFLMAEIAALEGSGRSWPGRHRP